jgi:hypothetical protein|tara:strand:- start:288 stop:545 length:258 start_codon:yes stop_codon:yes gene_type:complete
MDASIKPTNPFSPATLTIAMSDMTNLGRSVVVDLIMVQVIAMVLGTFLLIVTNGYQMTSTQLVWSMLILFTAFTMTGVVYRRLSN